MTPVILLRQIIDLGVTISLLSVPLPIFVGMGLLLGVLNSPLYFIDGVKAACRKCCGQSEDGAAPDVADVSGSFSYIERYARMSGESVNTSRSSVSITTPKHFTSLHSPAPATNHSLLPSEPSPNPAV